MRTTLLLCAALASIAVSAPLLAQDRGISCGDCQGECAPACDCNPTCGDPCCDCYCDPCCEPNPGCSETTPGCGETGQGCGETGQGGCEKSQDDTDPYTYYQLREAWRQEFRKANGPVVRGVRCAHCALKHHLANKHHCNGNAAAQRRASQTPWHGDYYYPQWGAPVPLVVPPTAEFQTNYSWGVPSMRIAPIDAQFSRNYPGYGPGVVGGNGFLPPPQQPSDSNQFGVYYVRGPW